MKSFLWRSDRDRVAPDRDGSTVDTGRMSEADEVNCEGCGTVHAAGLGSPPEGFRWASMTDGPATLPLSYRPFVPDFQRGFVMSSDLPPHLNALADEMDRSANRAELRDPESRRRKLRPARVNP